MLFDNGNLSGVCTVSTPAPKGVDIAYASSRSVMPRLACSSRPCFAKQGGAMPLATFSRISFSSCIYSSMSIWRCFSTCAFHGANTVGIYLIAGYLSTANLPGMLRKVSKLLNTKFSGLVHTHLTEVRRPIASAFLRTTISVFTSSTLRP
jgi:hypothetical protein